MQFFRPSDVTLKTEINFACIKPKIMDIQFCVNVSLHFDFRGMAGLFISAGVSRHQVPIYVMQSCAALLDVFNRRK